ncbi:hypothetical protein NDU88_001922 [Pleurodeles waltl]|uniref:Uncharacterized protein n=1 Tax=Pleurodeles waltl TaxID=8319 RepID=A0AAV7RCZ4_PLEWA|nr:hypothetical protein NDU88_001922 [Pleurodeles waltl]
MGLFSHTSNIDRGSWAAVQQSEGKEPDPDASSNEPTLGLIYSSVKQLQEETSSENRRAQIAITQLQGGRKVNKMCSEIGEWISARPAAMEMDLGALKVQTEGHETQLMDVMWKLQELRITT